MSGLGRGSRGRSESGRRVHVWGWGLLFGFRGVYIGLSGGYGMFLVEGRYQLRGMCGSGVFPSVFGRGVTLPSDLVLELLITSESSRIHYLIHFVFRFSFYKFRGWPRVIGAMFNRFAIRG